jgi:hypothetical protein
MADVLIAAIARACDESELEKVLSQCTGMEASRLTLFVRDGLREVAARSRMHFIPFQGSPLTSGTHGTNVPGLGRTLALSAYLIDDGSDHLQGIGISNDDAHYYNIAIDEGGSVVTYMASTENAALIEGQFRACGFVKIRRFPLN